MWLVSRISPLSQFVMSMTLAGGAESMKLPEVWRTGGDIVALELGGPWPVLSSESDEGLFSFLFDFSGCICVKGLEDRSMCAISIIISAADDVIETILSVSDDSLHVSLFGSLLLLVFSLASSIERSDGFRSLARTVFCSPRPS